MKLKSERQIRKIRTALISGIALVAVGATVAPVTHAADITTGGIECVSNNLSQHQPDSCGVVSLIRYCNPPERLSLLCKTSTVPLLLPAV